MYQYVKIDILSIPLRIEAIYANLVQAYVYVYKHQQGTCSLRYNNTKRSECIKLSRHFLVMYVINKTTMEQQNLCSNKMDIILFMALKPCFSAFYVDIKFS